MKIIGYIVLIGALIVMFLNGNPHSWGKLKSGMPVWKHLLIDLGGLFLMALGFTLMGK